MQHGLEAAGIAGSQQSRGRRVGITRRYLRRCATADYRQRDGQRSGVRPARKRMGLAWMTHGGLRSKRHWSNWALAPVKYGLSAINVIANLIARRLSAARCTCKLFAAIPSYGQ